MREWCAAPATEAFNELVTHREENARLRDFIVEESKRLESQSEAHPARWLRLRLDQQGLRETASGRIRGS